MADWKSLTDGEWVNIVNSDAVKSEGSYVHGAVCVAFKLIEAKLREKNEVLASFPVAVPEEGDDFADTAMGLVDVYAESIRAFDPQEHQLRERANIDHYLRRGIAPKTSLDHFIDDVEAAEYARQMLWDDQTSEEQAHYMQVAERAKPKPKPISLIDAIHALDIHNRSAKQMAVRIAQNPSPLIQALRGLS